MLFIIKEHSLVMYTFCKSWRDITAFCMQVWCHMHVMFTSPWRCWCDELQILSLDLTWLRVNHMKRQSSTWSTWKLLHFASEAEGLNSTICVLFEAREQTIFGHSYLYFEPKQHKYFQYWISVLACIWRQISIFILPFDF